MEENHKNKWVNCQVPREGGKDGLILANMFGHPTKNGFFSIGMHIFFTLLKSAFRQGEHVMRKWILLPLVLLVVALFLFAQNVPAPDPETQAIIQTALDYGDGFYSGDAARMERAIHPDLNKVFPLVFPGTGKVILSYSTFSGLVEMSRAKVGWLDPDKRKTRVAVLEIKDDMACAKLTSAMYNDYLAMAKFDGQWKIVNVLWTLGPDTPMLTPLPAFDFEKEREAIKAAVLEFYQGRYTGDVDRIQNAVHPELKLAQLSVLPPTGKVMVSRQGWSSLAEVVRSKAGLPPEDKRKAEVRVLDGMDGLAFAVGDTPVSTYYFQLALIEGHWRIINILSKAKTPAPGK
jgi:hypothetical protein